MDEMKIKTHLMRGIISKIVKKTLSKKLGYDIDILIDDIEIKTIDGDIHFYIKGGGMISSEEFKKIIKDIGLN